MKEDINNELVICITRKSRGKGTLGRVIRGDSSEVKHAETYLKEVREGHVLPIAARPRGEKIHAKAALSLLPCSPTLLPPIH